MWVFLHVKRQEHFSGFVHFINIHYYYYYYKMGHKVQPQQNVSLEGMVKMRIARVNMAS